MEKNIVIEVNSLSKDFERTQNSTGKGTFTRALKNVSFTVERGESVGILGNNGSGKSTLLKILAGVTKPSNGRVFIRGRVASILEIGAGFHPDLSGRENIYLNSTVHGFARSETAAVEQQIIEYSGISDFIDEPVKNYSSGMTLRLAFSIIAHFEFDIYLLDEIFSVGDDEFKSRSRSHIDSLRDSGDRTLILVSHDPGEIARICNRVVLLRDGAIVETGTVSEALLTYSLWNNPSLPSLPSIVNEALVETLGTSGKPQGDFLNTEAVTIRVRNQFSSCSDGIKIGLRIRDRLGNVVFNSSPIAQGDGPLEVDFKAYNTFTMTIPARTFNAGFFTIDLVYFDHNSVLASLNRAHHFNVELEPALSVLSDLGESGPLRPYLDWNMTQE